jgi:hypothetical protein
MGGTKTLLDRVAPLAMSADEFRVVGRDLANGSQASQADLAARVSQCFLRLRASVAT